MYKEKTCCIFNKNSSHACITIITQKSPFYIALLNKKLWTDLLYKMTTTTIDDDDDDDDEEQSFSKKLNDMKNNQKCNAAKRAQSCIYTFKIHDC